jgi:hypothetical protein
LLARIIFPEEKEYDPIGVLGIDLGTENIAVDSDREIFDCKKIENTRQIFEEALYNV